MGGDLPWRAYWALAHPHEYALIFGSPIPGYAAPAGTDAPASRVPLLLGDLLGDLMSGSSYDAAAHNQASIAVQRAMDPVRAMMPRGVPSDLMARGVMAWTCVFSVVSFEVFGRYHNVLADSEAFFVHEIRQLAAMVGLAPA